MLAGNDIITLKPVADLLKASKRDYVTAHEYQRMLVSLARNPRTAASYEAILIPLNHELFLGRTRVSKRVVQQQVNLRLHAAQLNFRGMTHKPLYQDNVYYPPLPVTRHYDLAFYNSSAAVIRGHGHYSASQRSVFYLRLEAPRDSDNLLVGNLQTAQLENAGHPLWQRQNLKKLMLQLAIRAAQRMRRKYLTFHSGDALVIAQNWNKPPEKHYYHEKTLCQHPRPEQITSDNLEYYRALHSHKIKLLNQAPQALKNNFYINHQEYEIIKNTGDELQLKPYGLFKRTADPFGYLFRLGAQQIHARNLAQTRPEIKLSPAFKNLPDLTGTQRWGDKIYEALGLSMCTKNYRQFTECFNKIIKKLIPEIRLGSTPKSIACINHFMNNFSTYGGVSGAVIVRYMQKMNYLEAFFNKYHFLEKISSGQMGQASFFQHKKPTEFAGLILNLENILPPTPGSVYTSATDYLFRTEDYQEMVVEISGINPRYTLYNFYEKEIPKLLKQLGYNCTKLPLNTTKSKKAGLREHTSYGWQIAVPPPAPLVIF